MIQQHDRRLLADRPMRAFFIVVLAPILQLFLSIRKTQEPVGVQTFRSEAAVEGFDVSVVRWLSRSREVQSNLV